METGAPDNEYPLYKNDQQQPRSSCQKKKEFVRFEYAFPRRGAGAAAGFDLPVAHDRVSPPSAVERGDTGTRDAPPQSPNPGIAKPLPRRSPRFPTCPPPTRPGGEFVLYV
jgi:hypothetical protein